MRSNPKISAGTRREGQVLHSFFCALFWSGFTAALNLHMAATQVGTAVIKRLRVGVSKILEMLGCKICQAQLVNYKRMLETLDKIPNHIGFALVLDKNSTTQPSRRNEKRETRSEGMDSSMLKSLAKEISWAYVANIHVVSLYDQEGLLWSAEFELLCHVQREIEYICGILNSDSNSTQQNQQKFMDGLEIPHIVFLKGDDKNQRDQTSRPILKVRTFSYEDGKAGVVAAIRGSSSRKEEGIEGIGQTEEVQHCEMDRLINYHVMKDPEVDGRQYDPEVLVLHGNITSTLGFLPWHTHLTEFIWIPQLKNIGLDDFSQALKMYGNCNQKFGA